MYKRQIIRPATVSGVYEGKPIFGLGEHDRLFIPTEINGFDGITNNFGYVYMKMCIRDSLCAS